MSPATLFFFFLFFFLFTGTKEHFPVRTGIYLSSGGSGKLGRFRSGAGGRGGNRVGGEGGDSPASEEMEKEENYT